MARAVAPRRGLRLLAEGFRPLRGEHWHAASVRNLLLSKAP